MSSIIILRDFEKLNFCQKTLKNIRGLSKLEFNFFLKDSSRTESVEYDGRKAKMKQLCKWATK